MEQILGQFGGVLAQDVDVESQVDICQADGVDGERTPAILPVPELGTQRMVLATKQLIHLLYGDFTKLMYFAIPVKLKGSTLPE